MNGRILTIGTFDLIHVGHVELFARMKESSHRAKVFVSVNSDEFVERFKGRKPVIPQIERIEMVGSIRWVDYAFPNYAHENALTIIDDVQPERLAIGSDWQDKDYLGQLNVTKEQLIERGLWPIWYVPRTTGVSSTLIRSRLPAGALGNGL